MSAVALPSGQASATLSLSGKILTSTLPESTTSTVFKMLTEVQDVLAAGEGFKRMVVEVDSGVYTVTMADSIIYILLTVRS